MTTESTEAVQASTLDEAKLRKPDFSDGYKVNLSDGNDWTFPKPLAWECRFVFDDDKATMLRKFPSEHIDAISDIFESEGVEQIEKCANLAARLLRQNYSLTNEELRSLLVYRLGEDGQQTEENAEMWDSIMEVAMGASGPKASAVGSS